MRLEANDCYNWTLVVWIFLGLVLATGTPCERFEAFGNLMAIFDAIF